MKSISLSAFLLFFIFQAKTQVITSYNLNVKIDVESKKLFVKGDIQIDFGNQDSIVLVLWKNSNIHSITKGKDKINFRFDTLSESPIMYIPNGRKLIVYKISQGSNIQTFNFDYESSMKDVNGWARSFTEDWIELNFYCAWFPLNQNSRNFTSKLDISIDKNYKVTGSGVISRKKSSWEMNQSWGGFDNVIIASKNLKSRIYSKNKIYIETVYSDFSEANADSVIAECQYAFDLYQELFGNKDSTYLKFIISPFEMGGGYSRKNFVSLRTKSFNLHTRGGVGHEIAHFWWSNAPTTTWEDWLNEAFAEYSMLIYFRERLSNDVFNQKIAEYKESARNSPPIWGIDRKAPEAYTALYEKGALILCDFESRVGKEKLFDFLKILIQSKTKTTNDFLNLIEDKFSKETRYWFENKLKT